MENLFSEDPQFQRVQYKKLSDNTKEWNQEIASLVAEKLPKDLGLSVVVVFQKIDNEKGYAVGSAIATDEASKSTIGIPIIVKSWHLAPLDLFFRNNTVVPLTDDNLAQAFYQTSMGTGLAPVTPTPNMADDSFAETRIPPMGGKYSYSSPHSMLSAIAGTIGAEDLKLFKTAVAKNPALLGAYHRRGTVGILNKLSAEAIKPTEQDESNKERASSVFTVKKDSPNSYRLFSAPDEVYDPVVVSTDRQGMKRFLEMRRSELWDYEQDAMNNIDQFGHFTIIPPESVYGKEVDGPSGSGVDGSGSYGGALGVHRNPWVFDPLQDDRLVRTIDKFGRYGVKDADGVLAKGWVIPNVVDFSGKAKPIKLFLGKSLASMQGRIAGIPLNDDANVALQADRPDTGKLGTLVYRDGEKIFATVPFQVTSVTVFNNLRSLGIIDYQGKQANLIISPNVEGIVEVSAGQKSKLGPLLGPGSNYIISAKMFFVRMPRLCAVSEGPDDFKRMAAAWLDKNPIKVAQANGRFIFKGGPIAQYAARPHCKVAGVGVEKVSFDFNSLARHEAEFLLGYWGLGAEKVAEVLNQSKNRIQLEVHHLRFPKVAREIKTASPKMKGFIDALRAPIADLLKCASAIENAQAVDTVLSLGFVNDENIKSFVASKTMLIDVSQMLAKLLLAARLGLNDVPEENVRAAIGHIQKVLLGLSRLQMLSKSQTKTASAARPASHIGGRLTTSMNSFGFVR